MLENIERYTSQWIAIGQHVLLWHSTITSIWRLGAVAYFRACYKLKYYVRQRVSFSRFGYSISLPQITSIEIPMSTSYNRRYYYHSTRKRHTIFKGIFIWKITFTSTSSDSDLWLLHFRAKISWRENHWISTFYRNKKKYVSYTKVRCATIRYECIN